MDKYRTEIKDSCVALWKIWVPAQAINFAFVPRHMRIPFVAAVSFGWTVVLSVMQGKFDAARLEAAAEVAANGGRAAPASTSTSASSSEEKEGGGAGAGVKAGAAVAASPAPGGGGRGGVALAPPTPPRGLKEFSSGGGDGRGGRIVAASAAEPGAFAAALATAAAARA